MSSRFWRFWACFVAANSDRWRSWWPLPQIDDPSQAGITRDGPCSEHFRTAPQRGILSRGAARSSDPRAADLAGAASRGRASPAAPGSARTRRERAGAAVVRGRDPSQNTSRKTKQARRCMPGAGGAPAERDPQTDALGHVASRRRLREHRGSLAVAPGSPLKSTSDERQLGRHQIQGLPLAVCSSSCPIRYYSLWSTNAARGILKTAPRTELWPEHMLPSLPKSRDPKKGPWASRSENGKPTRHRTESCKHVRVVPHPRAKHV